jgi:hypothetical protein
VAVVQVNEPGDDVTVYPVIVAPPLLAGAVHDTVAWAAPETPTTEVGAPGTASGVTEPEDADDELLPTALVAVTLNVYGLPLVSPLTVQLVVAVVQVNPPGEEVTV